MTEQKLTRPGCEFVNASIDTPSATVCIELRARRTADGGGWVRPTGVTARRKATGINWVMMGKEEGVPPLVFGSSAASRRQVTFATVHVIVQIGS